MPKNDILIILTCLIILLVVILLIIFFHNKNNKKMKEQIFLIKKKISKEQEVAITTDLKRIGIIAQSNKDIAMVFKELNFIYKNFFVKVRQIKNLILKLEKEINQSKIFYRKWKSIYKIIDFELTQLASIKNKFNNLACQVLKQDKTLRTEFHFYQKLLRKIIDVYQDKKILFDNFIDKIHNFKLSIHYQEKEFEKFIDCGDIEKGFIIIQRYIQKIIVFTKLINNGPSLIAQINIKIPQFVNKIKQLYAVHNQQVQSLPLSGNWFWNELKKITKKNDQIKKLFVNLEIDKTVIKIKDILKNLQKLENKVKSEINAEKQFLKIHKKIVDEINLILNKCKLINVYFKNAKNTELEENALKNKLNTYHHNIKNASLSSLDKINEIKKLIIFTNKVTGEINDFIYKNWVLNFENMNFKNKFIRTENAIHKIIAFAKKKNIILSTSDQKVINNILNKKAELSSRLQVKINEETKNEIKKFSENSKYLYILFFEIIQ